MTWVLFVTLAGTCLVLVTTLRATHRRAERERQLREFFATRRHRHASTSPDRPGSVDGRRPRTAAQPAGGAADPPAVAVLPPPPGQTPAASERFRVEPASGLPTFADVGGMDELKRELRDTVGLLVREADRAAAYGITWSGLLLHGPPGVGKTFLARALAGELGLALLHVSTGDLVEGVVGASARNVERAFELAAAHRPSLLLFDEFDSIAQRRDAGAHAEERRTVNQLLTSLERWREAGDLVVAATTNDLEHLDPAVIRDGRFDRRVRVDLPDAAARRAVLAAQLARRPACDRLDLDALARRTDGLTPASLAAIVDAAALAAFGEAAERGDEVRITMRHLLDAAGARGGRDRPGVEDWDWDDLVLPPGVVEELQQVLALLTEPDLAERFGVEPPRGLLLTGPPGTGKTTIGRVLAARGGCSFYPVSAADVTSKWVGESERSVRRLFERARAHRPSIVFIDEIDALGARRDGRTADAGARQLNQLLVEMDGLARTPGVLVVGATNQPELLDPALTRGGRLSRRITLTLPTEPARLAILERATARMPTVGVDLARIAARTGGLSGADLKALAQQAAVHGLMRARSQSGELAAGVLPEDFERALDDLSTRAVGS